MIAKVDPMGDRTTYTFDALNRQTVVVRPKLPAL